MKRVSFIVSVAALLMPVGAMADGHEEEAQPSLSDVWWVVPKHGMETEFAEAAAAHMAFRAEAGEEREWQAYRVAVGHNIAPIQFRSCCYDWADLDAHLEEDGEKGLGEHWNANVHQYVDHYHHYIEDSDMENSHWPEDGTDGPYYGVTTWSWKQGAGPAPGEARKKLSQMALSEGWANDDNNWIWMTREAGEPKLMIVSSYANYADMAPPEQTFFEFIAEKTGSEEEASKVFSVFASGFTDSDYTVWVLDEELSSPNDDD